MLNRMGDFTTDGRRLALLSAIAVALGILAALVAFVLLRLIGLITNVAFFSRFATNLASPDYGVRGLWGVLVPVVGGLVVGLIARYGSDKIRGHGIPEAIQSILERDSHIQARVAFFKPIASAVTIGTGGPFGAEGPIIMTGGALGSLIAQYFNMSSLERRTLLVAGAAGGMSATFGAPISSVFLAVELLLFEWRPRSFIPVAVAAVVAFAMRTLIMGNDPIFGAPRLHTLGWQMLPWALLVGVAAGLGSGILTKLVYVVEDAYHKLPIHWMWWPAIGGLAVGIGGLFDARALGVGYPTIRALVTGNVVLEAALAIIVVKTAIWILSLSSGTSGGVLAPLLLIGGALGALLSPIIPGHDAAIWAAIGMAAMLGGTMRAPFTATIFAMETTHAWGLITPVFVGCIGAMVVTVLLVQRSILTEKIARRGTHVAREYSVHPLEGTAVSQIMVPREQAVTVRAEDRLADVAPAFAAMAPPYNHNTYPVVDEGGRVVGIVHHNELVARAGDRESGAMRISDVMRAPVIVHRERRVRTAVERMAKTSRHSVVVVDERGEWVGYLSQGDVLRAWRRAIQGEEKRVRMRSIRRGVLNAPPVR
ncbi:MAG: chloride channel protein [bacterium]|nr:chloride channel protein [bacterium]